MSRDVDIPAYKIYAMLLGILVGIAAFPGVRETAYPWVIGTVASFVGASWSLWVSVTNPPWLDEYYRRHQTGCLFLFGTGGLRMILFVAGIALFGLGVGVATGAISISTFLELGTRRS